MAARGGMALGDLSADDVAALRLSAQVMAHRAALAGLPRVELFFARLEAEADAEAAARGQRGPRVEAAADPWQAGPLTTTDRSAIVAYLELLAGNDALAPAVRHVASHLVGAEPLS